VRRGGSRSWTWSRWLAVGLTGRKRAAARATAARAQKQSEQAAQAIIQLWARVGRVRIRPAPGPQVAVTRDGAPVDPAQDVIVNAGGDELVFTHRDGRVERVAVQVAAGAFVKLDAPAGQAEAPAVARAPQPRERDGAKPAAPVATRADATKPVAPPDAALAMSSKPRAAHAPVTPARSDGPADGDNCTVTETTGGVETELARCGDGGSPCWIRFVDPAGCPGGDHVGIAIRRAAPAPATGHAGQGSMPCISRAGVSAARRARPCAAGRAATGPARGSCRGT
jgi:hypothetical protein